MATKVDGLLFDKDGTLFNFHASWTAWTASIIHDLAEGDAQVAQRLAETLGYDPEQQSFAQDSVVIADTPRRIAEFIAGVLPNRGVDDLETQIVIAAAEAPQSPSLPLAPYLTDLSTRGLVLGVMTNDHEFAARAHLKSAGVEEHFDFIAGSDSGFGAKPDPGPLLAFAKAHDLTPDRVAMVGDSPHDLIAGRAAGMQTVGVLTGVASSGDLLPFADIVFPDIGHIPAWLAA